MTDFITITEKDGRYVMELTLKKEIWLDVDSIVQKYGSLDIAEIIKRLQNSPKPYTQGRPKQYRITQLPKPTDPPGPCKTCGKNRLLVEYYGSNICVECRAIYEIEQANSKHGLNAMQVAQDLMRFAPQENKA